MLHMTLMNVISTVSLARKLFYPQGLLAVLVAGVYVVWQEKTAIQTT